MAKPPLILIPIAIALAIILYALVLRPKFGEASCYRDYLIHLEYLDAIKYGKDFPSGSGVYWPNEVELQDPIRSYETCVWARGAEQFKRQLPKN